MPIYTVRREDSDSGTEWEVNCTYVELQEMCLEYKLVHVMKPLNMIQGVGSALSKTDNGWKEHLGRIKQSSGRGNTIKT